MLISKDNSIAKADPYEIVFIADGFILEDLQPGKDYDKYANMVFSNIFSKEPFATYKDDFTLYVIYVESPKRGLGGGLGSYIAPDEFPSVNNKKLSAYLTRYNLYPSTRLIQINDQFPSLGITHFELNSIFETGGNTEYVSLHEFGHTLRLKDEYTIATTKIPYKDYFPNVSNTNNLSTIKCKKFVGRPGYNSGYDSVAAFEGALYTLRRMWRPTAYSIMRGYNKNHFEFKGPSRETIVQTIKERIGEPYNEEEFFRLDLPKKIQRK